MFLLLISLICRLSSAQNPFCEGGLIHDSLYCMPLGCVRGIICNVGCGDNPGAIGGDCCCGSIQQQGKYCDTNDIPCICVNGCTEPTTTTEEPTTTIDAESLYYNLFAIQWKPQMCYKNAIANCHDESIPNITIHGIWPNAFSGSHPAYCSGPQLQHEDIECIKDPLDIYWPTLVGGKTNFDFWAYEYQKHGTCWYIANQTEYFATAIAWMETQGYKEIQHILAASGIYASNENIYALEDVTNAISEGLNQTIAVRCSAGKYIKEFFICRDWYGTNKIDCPQGIKTNCNDKVILSLQVSPPTTTTKYESTTTETVNKTPYLAHDLMVINQVDYDSSYNIQMFLLICFVIIAVCILVAKCRQYTQRSGYMQIKSDNKSMHHSMAIV